MYFDKDRWTRHATISLIDTDATGKRFRIPKEKIPSFLHTTEDAINYCKSMAAKRDAAHIRAARRREWESRRYDFVELMERYQKDRQRQAPNSWETDVSYTRSYVIPFFLNEVKSNAPVLWSDHYDDFRVWLSKVEPIKSKRGMRRGLALSTQNLCVKALNNFLTFMMRKERMEAVPLCKTHPRRLVRRKSAEGVMTAEVQEKIHGALVNLDPDCAEFFQFLNQTGLRGGEALGVSVGDTIDAQPGGPLAQMLEQFSLRCHGYILLESQVRNPLHVRAPAGTVPRRPLKHRHKIDPTEGRTIPIFSKELFALIERRWMQQREQFGWRRYGANERDYLLFDGLSKARYYTEFKRACHIAKVRSHVPHDSRHTFSTELVGRTGGHYLLAQIMGHRDQRETMGYTHVYKQVQLEAQRRAQMERGFGSARIHIATETPAATTFLEN